MTLQKHEYEDFLGRARIQPREVSKLHLAWGLRTEKEQWVGSLLFELTRGRGPRGGKKGKNRFALLNVGPHGVYATWNTHLDQGWGKTFRLKGDKVVDAPETFAFTPADTPQKRSDGENERDTCSEGAAETGESEGSRPQSRVGIAGRRLAQEAGEDDARTSIECVPSKAELLARACHREARRFHEVEAWVEKDEDRPPDTFHRLSASVGFELAEATDVRVQIRPDLDRDTRIKLLAMILEAEASADWQKRDPLFRPRPPAVRRRRPMPGLDFDDDDDDLV